jgi:hypothetical protein
MILLILHSEYLLIGKNQPTPQIHRKPNIKRGHGDHRQAARRMNDGGP